MINQVLDPVAHVLVNFFLSPVKFINLFNLYILDISKAFYKLWHEGLICKLN